MSGDSQKLLELAERVEKAEGQNRDLDAEIYSVLNPDAWVNNWLYIDKFGFGKPVPDFTASLDAALTLVPEGWSVDLVRHRGDVGNVARVYNDGLKHEPSFIVHENLSLPIALCAAALRARAAL